MIEGEEGREEPVSQGGENGTRPASRNRMFLLGGIGNSCLKLGESMEPMQWVVRSCHGLLYKQVMRFRSIQRQEYLGDLERGSQGRILRG